MCKLEDCSIFKASVAEEFGKFFVIVLGFCFDSDKCLDIEVVRKKQFDSKQACMDFLTNQADYNYKFTEDDFLFASKRYFSIDYFGCGVDFDED